MRGRHFEGAGAADDEHCGEQKISAERLREQREHDHARGKRVDAVRRADDQPAVVAVRRMADQQCEHDRRHKLDQSHQAEIECAVGDFVDLPADRQSEHLVAHGRGEPRQPEEDKGPLLEETCR